MKKAETIVEIYQAFAPEKYLTIEDKDFYVDLYSDDLRRFSHELINNSIPGKSFFVAGQSGNGKSTVLNFLNTKYPALKDKYEFRYLAGREVFSHPDINIIDLLLMIGANLIHDDQELQKTYFEELNKLQESHDGLLQIEALDSTTHTTEGKASASLGMSINFLSIFKSKGSLEASYKENDAFRETAKRIFKTKESDLIRLINEIILAYKSTQGNDKEILIIIDDLEKRENIEPLFLRELHHLDSINMVKIITMPIHLRRTETFNAKDVREFALKLHSFDNTSNDSDKDLLKEVIENRIADKSLIDSNTIDKIIEHSGGNLRQLIRLVQLSANEADTFAAATIEDKELDYAVEFMQRGLSSPVMMMQTFLTEILEHKTLKNDTPEGLDQLGKAIKMGLVFAYFNGKIWYEINPLIKKILEDYIKSR